MPNFGTTKAVSRRGFLCGFSVVGAAALLSACELAGGLANSEARRRAANSPTRGTANNRTSRQSSRAQGSGSQAH